MTMRNPLAAGLIAVVTAGSAFSATAQPHQLHMQKALASLEDAKRELALAARDKGGHRKRAADAVDEAISQVHEGMAAREDALRDQARQAPAAPRR